MNRAIATLIITAFSLVLSGQSSLEEIFRSSRDFYKIVADAEVYFDRKYPGLTPWERTVGEHRDGEYVKFMRWRSFWEDRLNADGTLGDPTAHFIEKEKRYEMEVAREGDVFKLVSKDKKRATIKTPHGECFETVEVRIFLPDRFDPDGDHRWKRKTAPEEEKPEDN